MASSNFSDEIKQSMISGAAHRTSGSRQPPHPAAQHNSGAVPKAPPPPLKAGGGTVPPQQSGMQQGTDVPGMNTVVPQRGGLEAAHQQVVNALMARDRGA